MAEKVRAKDSRPSWLPTTYRCGHDITEQNTYSSAGRLRCRTCWNTYHRQYKRRTRSALREQGLRGSETDPDNRPILCTRAEAIELYGATGAVLDTLPSVGVWYPTTTDKRRSTGEPMYRTEDVRKMEGAR